MSSKKLDIIAWPTQNAFPMSLDSYLSCFSEIFINSMFVGINDKDIILLTIIEFIGYRNEKYTI